MKIPKARKLPSGSWFIQLRLNGQSVPVTASTEKKCIAEARLIKAGHKAGQRLKKKSGLTLREAIDSYISARDKTLSPSTLRGYALIRDNRFQEVIDSPIEDIKNWQAICNDEAARYKPKTLKNSWLFVASVLKENDIEIPKIKLPQIVKEERPFLEPDDILAFVAAIHGTACELPALLALHGLRRSEIWAIPEVSGGVIYVRGAAVLNKEHKLEVKPTNKNQPSRRDVPVLIPRLSDMVQNIKDIETKNPDVVKRQIDAVCAAQNLPAVGLHGLRHSFASLGYHLGVPEAYIMQIGGWSDYTTVRKIYTHLAKKDALKSQRKMVDFFNNANEVANGS